MYYLLIFLSICIICLTIIVCKFIDSMAVDTYDYNKLSKRINSIEENLRTIKDEK